MIARHPYLWYSSLVETRTIDMTQAHRMLINLKREREAELLRLLDQLPQVKK